MKRVSLFLVELDNVSGCPESAYTYFAYGIETETVIYFVLQCKGFPPHHSVIPTSPGPCAEDLQMREESVQRTNKTRWLLEEGMAQV